MQIWGIILLVVSLSIMINWYVKDGILFFCNYSRLGCLIWLVGLALYDLQLSKICKPDIMINVIIGVVIVNFAIMSKILPSNVNEIYETYTSIRLPNNSYKIFVLGTFMLGAVSFFVNFKNGNLRFFLGNTSVKTSVQLSYFLNLLVIVSLFFYFAARVSKEKVKKIIYFILSGVSLFFVFSEMSRGPFVFWFTGMIMFELCQFVKRNRSKYLSKKQLIFLILMAILFIYVFGMIGDFRTNSIFRNGASVFYKMPEKCPSGFTWIYIYITSPLENMRYILNEEIVHHFSYFNKLLYPVIKFGANIIGMGDQYATYVQGFNDVYAYLKPQYGLNVSTFMADAYSDLGLFGIIVYLICYDVIAYFVHRILVKKNINAMSKSIIFPIVIQIAIWSIFSNSVFVIAGIWIDILFVFLWEKIGKCKFTL